MRIVFSTKLKSPSARGLRGAMRFRKKLPAPRSFAKGHAVHDTEWVENEHYLDDAGRLVRVVETQDVFMGKAALIAYSNDALRWISYETELWTIRGDSTVKTVE